MTAPCHAVTRANRGHVEHEETDVCPVPTCLRPWSEWPNAHKADVVCSIRCERDRPDLAVQHGLRQPAVVPLEIDPADEPPF